ncbi:MAG: RES family NAD+ phosphorylase [bacterium]|nr:RES family NAD+ phosphorylase [bacterium]
MQVYRIEKSKYKDVFPPRGSLYVSGRWHAKGTWVVYCSENIALAKLEVLANSGQYLPEDCILKVIDIAEDAPMARIEVTDLKEDWFNYPAPSYLAQMTQNLIDSKLFVGAIVPSVQSWREKNFLLFPDFKDFDKYVKEVEVDVAYFDRRLKGN